MSYKIETVTTNDPTTNQIGLGIKLPFNGTGVFTINYDNNSQATSNLKNLLLTRTGERFEQPKFGTDLLNVLFEPMNDVTEERIVSTIQNAVAYWLPYITLDLVDVEFNQSDAILNHTVKVSITYSTSEIETNTIVIFANENGVIRIE
jgi:phage baseplate assembly protein W